MNAEQFKKFRIRKGLTQASAAKLFKVTQSTVSRWETGACAIPPLLPEYLKAITKKPVRK